MKEDIEDMVSQFESGQMSRRQLIGQLTAAAAMVAGGAEALGAQGRKGPGQKEGIKPTAQERKPFEEIARRKGVTISFDAPATGKEAKTTLAAESMATTGESIHLDMEMVEESLRNAIKRTGEAGQLSIQGKLKQLLETGTDAEKVEFVLGSGTYYFPGDVAQLANLSRLSGGRSLKGIDCKRVCETIYYLVCRCIQLRDAQECHETSRIFCEIRCGKD